MTGAPQTKRSFSTGMRWGHGVDLVVRTTLVLAVVVMVNYLGGRWYERLYLNAHSRQPLSPRTVGLLNSITNHVRITLYYDRLDPIYSKVTALLDEYRDRNARIHVTSMDYVRDAGAALKLREDYKDRGLNVGTNKDLVIFECEGRVKAVNGRELAQYITEKDREGDPEAGPMQFRKRMMFYGENLFTATLLAVLNPKPFKACYLTGHDEPSLEDAGPGGYRTFLSILAQNCITNETCILVGTNRVPADCSLLIIAGPLRPLSASELEKIDDYLRQGGRMLALFNSGNLTRPSGLERVLNYWGVGVTNAAVLDPKNTTGHADVIAYDFAEHPVVNALNGSALQLIMPRTIGRLTGVAPLADAPSVQELAFSSAAAVLDRGQNRGPKAFPLAVAVEKGSVKGVITERGTTRIVAVGDSIFLNNRQIESAGNKDFLGYAVNWLLERTQLMQGLGPRPVTEYRLTLGAARRHTVQWLLLGAIPGAALAFGGVVWLRRRK
jgi:hypothetical protein